MVDYRKRGPGRSGAIMATNTVRDPGASLTPSFYDVAGNPIANPDAYVGNVYDSSGAVWADTINANEPNRTFIPTSPVQSAALFGEPGRREDIMDPSGSTFAPPSPLTGSPFSGPAAGVPGERSPLAMPPPNFDPSVAAAWADYIGSASRADEAAVSAEQAQQAIDLKEMALREAMLNGDVADATRLIGEIQAAKDYMKRSFQDYRNTVTPVYNESIANSGLIQDKNTVPLADIAAQESGGIQEAFMGADADISKESRKIGADATAEAAAKAIAGELTGLYLETSEGRQDDAQSILTALENAAVESSKAFKVEDLWNIDNRERIDQAERDQDLRNAQEDLDDLDYRRQALELDKERTNIQHAEALRVMRETGGELPYMDAVGFGRLTSTKYLNSKMDAAGISLDRQSIFHSVMADAWKVGVFDPGQMEHWLTSDLDLDTDGFQTNASQYGYPPLQAGEIAMIIDAMGAYGRGRDQYDSLSSITGVGEYDTGTASTQMTGTGASPNMDNAAAARRGDGPYGARAIRVSAVKDEVMSKYDVNYLGQWRDLDAEVTKDRDPNSDHYSGGALDFSGTEAEMIRLKTYLDGRSDVKFARIHGNPRHVHVSFEM